MKKQNEMSGLLSACDRAWKALSEERGTQPQAVRAARDTGDTAGDKRRRAEIKDLVEKATEAQKLAPDVLETFPEVSQAVEAVVALGHLDARLTELAARLKGAKSGTQEAEDAQEALDALRNSVSKMVSPLSATMSTLLGLVEAVKIQEHELHVSSERLDKLQGLLDREKASLEAAGRAVTHALGIG